MITGFNTDVEHDGVIYHVQTEDKGLETPLLLSLVYSGGAILASKRSSYQDLIKNGFNEAALAERLQRQHRLICAAINAGRIEDLKKMTPTQSKTGPLSLPPDFVPPDSGSVSMPPGGTVEVSAPSESSAEEIERFEISSDFEQFPEQRYEPPPPPPPPPPPADFEATLESPRPSAYTVYDSRRGESEAEAPVAEEGLRIFLAGEKDYKGGDLVEMDICVTRVTAQGEIPVAAMVSIKVLGTAFRPLIISLKTNRHGVASMSSKIPNFKSGRAAIVIKATANGQEIETRRVIHPG
jgi:hypothetical protein